MKLLTEEQAEQITQKLLMTDESLRETLDEMGLENIDAFTAEDELDIGYCNDCMTWAYEVFAGSCEICRSEEKR